MTKTVTLLTSGLTQADVVDVARHGAKVVISQTALDAMAKTREHIEKLAVAENAVYGISTGFGALANRHIDVADRVQLQKSLIRSHAAGMGAIVENEVTRALMLLRLKTLCSGRTGVRPEVAETYAKLLNANITPIVHEFGSLGCSGDLAPLAHCAMVVMGEGRAFGPDGIEKPVAELLRDANITPVELREKEGLALINGTDGMLGMLILAINDLESLTDSADVIAAMSVEGLLGTDQVFRPELHFALRPHAGQAKSAANMYAALAGSPIVASHRDGDDRVQDAYSLRCAPQVTGAVRDSIAYAKSVAENELFYIEVGSTELKIETDGPVTAILVGGVPFDEKIVMWWNFVAGSQKEITEAREQWNARDARFGDFEDQIGGWIPAPELPHVTLQPR